MEEAMTRWRAERDDLFEPRQPTGTVLAPQKATAVKLLTALLTEAFRPLAEQDIRTSALEAGDDQDHA
jgi:hypothetical protein